VCRQCVNKCVEVIGICKSKCSILRHMVQVSSNLNIYSYIMTSILVEQCKIGMQHLHILLEGVCLLMCCFLYVGIKVS